MPQKRPLQTQPMRPSLLDRLIDEAPDLSDEHRPKIQMAWDIQSNSIQLGIQHLLKTRQPFEDETLTDIPEAQRSFLTFGLPEFENLMPDGDEGDKALRYALNVALEHFEPELRILKINCMEIERLDGVARYSLEAWVIGEFKPQWVDFGAMMRVDRAEITISDGKPARVGILRRLASASRDGTIRAGNIVFGLYAHRQSLPTNCDANQDQTSADGTPDHPGPIQTECPGDLQCGRGRGCVVGWHHRGRTDPISAILLHRSCHHQAEKHCLLDRFTPSSETRGICRHRRLLVFC